jgi:hypothetical protein
LAMSPRDRKLNNDHDHESISSRAEGESCLWISM